MCNRVTTAKITVVKTSLSKVYTFEWLGFGSKVPFPVSEYPGILIPLPEKESFAQQVCFPPLLNVADNGG